MADRPLAEAPPALLKIYAEASAEGTRAERAVDEKGNVLIEGEADTDTAIALAIEYLKDAEPDAGPGRPPRSAHTHRTPPWRHGAFGGYGRRLNRRALARSAERRRKHRRSIRIALALAQDADWLARCREAFEVVEMPEGEKPRNDNAASEPSAEADGPAVFSAAQCLEEELSAEETPLVEDSWTSGWCPPGMENRTSERASSWRRSRTQLQQERRFAGREVRQGAVAYFVSGRRRFRRRLGALLRRDGRKDGFPLYLCAPPKQSIHSLDARKFMRRAIAKIERQSGQKVVLVIVRRSLRRARGAGRPKITAMI